MNREHRLLAAPACHVLPVWRQARISAILACVIGATLVAVARNHAIEVNWETEYLSGLRSRGLYRLAAGHAEAILSEEDVSPAARVDLTIELARTFSQWGLASPQGDRESRWDRAHACLHQARASLPNDPRSVLLELQDALLWLGEGELAKEEAVLTGSEAARTTARRKLRTAIATFESLSERIEESLRSGRLARGASVSDGGLSNDQLSSLAQHIALQSARALMFQAETYAAESPDRINALTRAVDQLNFLVSRGGDGDLRLQAEVELIACHRLLGHLNQALRMITAVSGKPKVPTGELTAESVRLLLATGRSAEAVATARQLCAESARPTPELLLAFLEALVADAIVRSDSSRQQQVIQEATQILAELAERHGPRWQRRGELWVARLLAATNQAADTLTTARLAAEGLHRAGRLIEAAAAFDRAAALARQEDNADAAFDLALAAAAVVWEAEDPKEAARRYVQLAASDSGHQRAAGAHRLGILATADAARTATSAADRTELLAGYKQLLQTHPAQWPESPTADEARTWLVKWSLQEAETGGGADMLDRAVTTLQEIHPSSEHFATSRRLLAEVYEGKLATVDDSAERAALANQAAHALMPVITGEGDQWPSEWTDLQRDVALALARMQLVYVPDGATYADALLSAAFAGSQGVAGAWRQRAVGLLASAKAVAGDIDDSEELLSSLADATTDAKAAIILDLDDVLLHVDGDEKSAVGRIVLKLFDDAPTAGLGLSESERTRLAHCRARALAAVGRRDEAVAAYNALIAQSPDDATAHEEYAALLASGHSTADHRAALRLYHEIEQRSKPGGPRWMQARFARIGLLGQVGEVDQARKLLRLTSAVHPGLGGPSLRSQLESLADQLAE